MTIETISLKDRWAELKQQNPHMRIRNAATELGVSEGELLATQVGEGVTVLKPEFVNILGEIESLGKVMALTRNNSIVHERKGVYLNPELNNPHVGLFVGEDIDLRIFLGPWKFAFAVTEGTEDKPRHSLQFFAKDGEAIHKIYLTPASNLEAYQALVAKYIAEEQPNTIEVVEVPDTDDNLPDGEIDVAGFREGWVKLEDTHHFFGLLKKFKINRTQALRLAPEGDYAVKVDNNALRNLITAAAEKQIPIMVFVGNKGMIQIHTGTVKKLMDHEGWFNVLDPDFNLHVKEADIVQSWIVRKPTTDGVVTALECFDANGKQVVQLFGKRKPGIPELEEWREIARTAVTAL